MNRTRTLAIGAAAAFCVTAISWSLLVAQFELAEGFEGSESVEVLVVSIDVGADGDELAEPVALDLGLGFPLWLNPVGRVEGELAPFGAAAQSATVGPTVAPGQRATFTFSSAGPMDQDVLETSTQLLQDVRISDIARIGFMSRGDSNWVLAGYEIEINGRRFAANPGVNLSVEAAREATVFRIAEVNLAIAPLEDEAADLRALQETGLATEDDLARLDAVTAELSPLVAERARLDAQEHGTYPWFDEPEFVSPWRSEAHIDSARVTVDTDIHPLADTSNLIYFQTGGHKFLIGTSETPLSGEFGPQTFELDLLSAPLTAADLRGFALGMLGHGGLNGTAPDRWHPRRLVVEIDGGIVYDSELSEVDRLSLEAIRIVPPAHVGPDAAVVHNDLSVRETYVWHAGSGTGLDLIGGGIADLPAEDDDLFPEPELPLEGWPEDGFVFEQDIWLFPGEYWPPGWEPGWWPGWEPGWEPEPWWPGDGWAGGFWWLPGLIEDIFDDILDAIDPVGEPFQITNVRITEGWREGDVFTIEWDVAGDASSIDSFTVDLMGVHPHDDPFLIPGVIVGDGGIDPSTRHWHLIVPPLADDEMFVCPLVTGISAVPVVPDDADFGPARPLFPETTSEDMQPQLLAWSGYFDGGGVSHDWPIEPDGNPAVAGRSIWSFPADQGHSDLELGDPRPGHNFGFRPGPTDQWIGVQLNGGVVEGHCRVIANVGFLGEPDPQNSANFTMHYVLTGAGFDIGATEVPVAVTGGFPHPLPLIELEFNTHSIGPGPFNLTILVGAGDLAGGGAATGSDDPDHPPAVFGLRVVPVAP